MNINEIAEELTKEFAYGDVIPKQWLTDKFEINYPEFGSKQLFEKLEFRMLANMEELKHVLLHEYKMLVINVKGVGYQIVQPNSQVTVAMRRMKASFHKELFRCKNSIENINSHRLSDNDRRKQSDSLGQLAAIAAFTQDKVLSIK